MHCIQNGDGTEELYDNDEDPRELDDLAVTERGAATLGRSRARARELLSR